MEEKLNILFENATWRFTHEFVTPDGVVAENKGEIVYRNNADRITVKRWFIDDYGQKIDVVQDLRKKDEHNFEYESNDIAKIGPLKGTIHVERNRLYTVYHMGNTPINGFELTVRNGNTCTVNGALYYAGTLIKTWNAVLTKVENG
jgi:hypothetical protein